MMLPILMEARTPLEIIDRYGEIDGSHHKQWMIDQVVRALTNCPIVLWTYKDCNGALYTAEVFGMSDEYREWVRQHNSGEDGPNTYEWDEGTPP